MAAPWPPQYQQGQGQPQMYAFNAYQQSSGQTQQPIQQPYAQQAQGQPHNQHSYMQQPQQHPQQSANYPGYGQQISNASSFSQPQQPYQMPMPQLYQYGYPQQQQPGPQTFNLSPMAPSGFALYGQLPQSSGVPYHPYSPAPSQFPHQAPGQQAQVAPGYSQQQQQYHHQQTQQAFATQQHSHSPTQTYTQQQQPQDPSTPQQNQYVPPESSSKHQSPQAPASPAKDQQQEKKPTVPCFNCGSFEHWAVSCPEPPRDVPAGVVNRQNQQHPAKRQKFNAPIITKYQVPPHVAHAQTPPQAQQAPPFGPPSYPHPAQQYPVQLTPVSAQSPPLGQWPQQLPYQQLPQYPQGGYTSQQPGSHQQRPYASMPQTPVQFYGPNPMSQNPPQTPQHVPPVNPPHAQHYPHPHQQPQSQMVQQFSSASPYPPTPSLAGPPGTQHSYAQQSNPGNAYQGTPGPYPPTQSQTATPIAQPAETDSIDDEEDDFSKLDIPDYPAMQGGPVPTLVGLPLPTNFVVADALAPFAAPALGDNGRCKSKYIDRQDISAKDKNIRDTEEWERHNKDPIFKDLPSGGNVILLSVLDLIYRPVRGEEYNECPDANDGETRDYASHKAEDGDQRDITSSPLNERRRSASTDSVYEPTERRRSASADLAYEPTERVSSLPPSPQALASAIATENVLASLGVTGSSKPVQLPPRPYPPPTPQEKIGDIGHLARSRSGSPRRYGSNSYENISPPDSGADGQHRNEESLSSQRDSYYREQSSRRWSDRPNSQRFEHPPPPPPPPPARKPSWYDGPNGSPLSADANHTNQFAPGTEVKTQNGNGAIHGQYTPESLIRSPIKLRTKRSYSQRMEYKMRDESSDEDETARRRQADDVTPKLKRRQPKVAEAYSRRW